MHLSLSLQMHKLQVLAVYQMSMILPLKSQSLQLCMLQARAVVATEEAKGSSRLFAA
jgi:hypothetical protein